MDFLPLDGLGARMGCAGISGKGRPCVLFSNHESDPLMTSGDEGMGWGCAFS